MDKHLVEFTTNLNDSDILMTTVAKKNYVYVRDRPAIEHLVYNDYLVRRKVNPINERSHCPFATATTPFLKRVRAFAYPNSTRWNALFDPQYVAGCDLNGLGLLLIFFFFADFSTWSKEA